jgi:hypothetical protein
LCNKAHKNLHSVARDRTHDRRVLGKFSITAQVCEYQRKNIFGRFKKIKSGNTDLVRSSRQSGLISLLFASSFEEKSLELKRIFTFTIH